MESKVILDIIDRAAHSNDNRPLELLLSEKFVADTALRYLAQAIREGIHSISTLDLSQNDFTDDGFVLLIKAIEVTGNIVDLRLSNNNISEKALSVLFASLQHSKCFSPERLELRCLPISSTHLAALTRWVKKSTSLRALDIRTNLLSPDELEALVINGLSRSETLVQVSLDVHSLSDTALEMLQDTLDSNAAHLNPNPTATQKPHTIDRRHALRQPTFFKYEEFPKEFANERLLLGCASMKGKRSRMEDAHCLLARYRDRAEETFVGVYDGHGGPDVAEFASQQLQLVLQHKLEQFERFKQTHSEQQQPLLSGDIIPQISALYKKLSTPRAVPTTKALAAQSLRDRRRRLAAQLSESTSTEDPAPVTSSTESSNGTGNSSAATTTESLLSTAARLGVASNAELTGGSFEIPTTEFFRASDVSRISDTKSISLFSANNGSAEPAAARDLSAVDESAMVDLLLRESFLELNSMLADRLIPHGSTAAVVYLRGNRCYIANAGDSRIVLSRKGTAVRLSHDHRPNYAEEIKRIEEAGGFVQGTRLNGVLAVSRAFGDATVTACTSDPFSCHFTLTPEDEFIIIACDGLWDVVSDSVAVQMIQSEVDPRAASATLRDYAYLHGSLDNISVAVIRFTQPAATATTAVDSESESTAAGASITASEIPMIVIGDNGTQQT